MGSQVLPVATRQEKHIAPFGIPVGDEFLFRAPPEIPALTGHGGARRLIGESNSGRKTDSLSYMIEIVRMLQLPTSEAIVPAMEPDGPCHASGTLC